MLEKELETAIALARQASIGILEFYALEIIVEEKFGVDNFAEPVTIADRTASRLIVEGLSAAFPDDAILSEEEPDDAEDRLTKKRAWMIDPIDGTKGFINRDGDFAVQIGLIENDAPILGVVYLPETAVLYFAAKNEGTFVSENGGKPRRLQVSGKMDFALMNLAVSRNHRSPRMSRVVENFGFADEIRRGSVGLKVGLIAEQFADLYVHLSPRTKFWDTCAPQIILEEAGGCLTDLFGAKIRYGQRDVRNLNGILATNGIVHDAAVGKLKSLLNEFGRLRVKTGSN